MTNPRLAGRYAKSLIDISREQGVLEEVYKDMLLMQDIIRNNRDFLNLLRSPVVNSDVKNRIIEAVTAGRISTLTTTFNKLLVTKGRESDLPEVITAFIKQYKEFKNIHVVKLTTATPVSEDIKSRIVEQVRRTSDMQNIELQTSVNEALIGGFTLEAGDKLVDASIAYDLKQISKQFENNDFIYKLV